MEFAVIDLETTGFSPNRRDRVVEVGVVILDDALNAIDEWETLVNPERDPGPTRVHGISASHVAAAPTFSQIAGDLAAVLEGRCLVAHNKRFDFGFLEAEYARLGARIAFDGMCTMAGAKRAGLPMQLTQCCLALGIAHVGSHSALGDARATAAILRCLDPAGELDRDTPHFDLPADFELPRGGRLLPRSGTTRTGGDQLRLL